MPPEECRITPRTLARHLPWLRATAREHARVETIQAPDCPTATDCLTAGDWMGFRLIL